MLKMIANLIDGFQVSISSSLSVSLSSTGIRAGGSLLQFWCGWPGCWNTVELQAHKPQTCGDPPVCGWVASPAHLHRKAESHQTRKWEKITTTAAWQGVDFWPGTILAFCPVIDFPFVSIVESERLLACYPENVIACRTQEKCNCWPTGVGPQANCITWPNAIWSGRWSFSIHLFLFKADWN